MTNAWPNDASQRKFAKPELAYGLAKGGQTDSQVGSQVAKVRKFHAYHWLTMRFYNDITCETEMIKSVVVLIFPVPRDPISYY